MRLGHSLPGPCLLMVDTTLLGMWETELAARGCSSRTRSEWPAVVGRAAVHAGRPVDALTREGIVAFLARDDLSAASKATYATALRAWSRWLCATGRRTDDPTCGLPRVRQPKGEPRPLTTAQVQRVLSSRMRRSTRVKLLLVCYAGLRVAEVARLRGEDVDPWGRTLTVRGKGGRVDRVALHPTLAALATGMPAAGWWFPSPAGGHVSGSSVSDVLGRAIRRAGVDGSAHQMRHWYATELVRADVPLTTVRVLMRHSSLATTQRYVAVADGAGVAALVRLPEVAA